MKNLITTITIITTIALLQACKRDDTSCGDQSDIIEIKNITNENKAKIPYTGTDTLVFISNTGDTATLLGKGKNIYYETVNNNLGTNECQRKFIGKYENINFQFNGNSLLSELLIKYYTNKDEDQILSISEKLNNLLLNSNECSLKYNNNENNYSDSILVNSKYLYGVENRGVFYNANYGILRMKFSNGKEYLNAR